MRPTTYRAAVLAAGLCLSPAALGGTLTTFTFTSDATSQISSSKTYTAKADPGSSGTGPATVNGVVFDRGALSTSAGSAVGVDTYTAPGVTYTIPAGAGQVGPLAFNGGNGFDLPGGSSAQLLTDMVFTSNGAGQGNVTRLTFTGLTAGQQYSARIYYRAWDAATARPSTITFDEDGAGPLGASAGSVDEDAGNNSDGIANVLAYNYTAVSNGAGGALPLIVNFTADTGNNSWHLYGVTNEVVPEPATAGVLGVAGLGLLARRRRQRR